MSSPLPTSAHILPVNSILIIQSHSSQSFSSSSSSSSSRDRVQKRLTSLPACSCTSLLKLSHQDLYNFIIIIISVIINVILIIRLKFQEVWTLTARTSCHTDVDTPTTVFFPFSLIKQAPPKLLSKYPPTPQKPPSAPLDHCPQNRSSTRKSVTQRMRRAGGAVAAFEANPNTDFCPKLGHHSAACTPDVLNLAFLARTATSWVPDNSTVLSEPAHKTASSPFTLIFGS